MTDTPVENLPPSCAVCGGVLRTEGGCRRCAMSGALEALEEACTDPAKAALLSDESRDALPVRSGFVTFAPPELPWRFDGYEVTRILATGGMGTVYAAEDLKLGRGVALKMIRGSAFSLPEEKVRFRAEAEAAAALDHPHIVPIYDIGEVAGQPYFTMKLIEGGTLAERLKDGPMAAPDAVAFMTKVAHAVHHAHQRGVLHRDLKPGNILMDAAGQPYLTDFGLAKLMDREAHLTLTKAQVGTPQYMSPEQAAGRTRDISTESDVWSLGAVLYEMLSGRLPFAGGSSIETLRLIQEAEPQPLHSRFSGVFITDRDLATIVARCLEKDPVKRLPSAEFLAEELERWREGDFILSRRVSVGEISGRWIRRHQLAAVCIAVAAVALVSGSGVAVWQAARATSAQKLAEQNAGTAQAAQREAERQLADAEAATVMITDRLVKMEHYNAGTTIRREKLVSDLIQGVEGFSGDPVRKARLLSALSSGLPPLQGAKIAERAVAIAEPVLNPDHPLLWSFRLEVARLKIVSDETQEEAVLELRPIIAWSREHLGSMHEQTLWAESLLGRDLISLGQPQEAVKLLEKVNQAIHRDSTLFSEYLRFFIPADYARALFRTGRREDALTVGRLNVKKGKELLSEPGMGVAQSMMVHAEVCREAGLPDEAAETARLALAILWKTAGPQASATTNSLSFLSGVYRETGRPEELLSLHQDAVREMDSRLGHAHSATLAQVRDYVRALGSFHRLGEADEFATGWLQQIRQADGRLPVGSEGLLRAHTEILSLMPDLKRSETVCEELVATMKKFRPADLQLQADLSNLAQVFIKQGRYAEAGKLLTEVIATLEKRHKDNPEMVGRLLPLARDRLMKVEKGMQR